MYLEVKWKGKVKAAFYKAVEIYTKQLREGTPTSYILVLNSSSSSTSPLPLSSFPPPPPTSPPTQASYGARQNRLEAVQGDELGNPS